MSNTATALPELNYEAMTDKQKAEAFDQALQVLTDIADFTDPTFQCIYDDFRERGYYTVVEKWEELLDAQ